VSSNRGAQRLEGLVDAGPIVPAHKVAERAEHIAQERLAALKADHGIPA
jgi:hypothetical protein